jgi:hypothetical protein
MRGSRTPAIVVALAAPLIAASAAVNTILWVIAAVLVIWGILTIVRGGVVMGIVLIIVGLLVGPGGVSIF